MKKRTKKILLGLGISILIIFGAGLGFFLYIKLGFRPEVFSLDDAPQEILDIQTDLTAKLDSGTFTWSDMPDFVTFSQYVADNSPLVLDLIQDWDEVVWFNITDQEFMWFLIENDSLILDIGTNPPGTYGIIITLNFATMVEIIHRDVTPQQSFQRGDLKFKGNFNDVLTVNQIVETAAATLMGSYTPPIEIIDNFFITVDNQEKYEEGLTLLPYIQINLDPDQIGVHHAATPSGGKAIIVNNEGDIVYELENSAHSVHKFMNSTHIIMGGQEGFMEIWNYKSEEVVTLTFPGGHHDFDYNPFTNTVMVLEYAYSNETWDGYPILYDKLCEYTLEGDLIWQWDGRTEFLFNSTRHMSLGLNLTFRGGADWMHSNSFVWDKENEDIYLNVRNLDTIVKIDYSSKDIIWEAGRLCNFTLYDKNDQLLDSLFHQSHSLEKLGENRFIIFDNDLYNESNPNTMTLENSQGFSRFLEFEINETAETMKEIWSWVPQNETYYLPESGGDADRLPFGNTLGIFGNKALVLNVQDPVIITEVTPDGSIAWELAITGKNYTYFWVHRVERFYEKPLVKIHESIVDLDSKNLNLNFTTWNNYKIDAITSGIMKIVVDKQEIYSDSFNFLPNWIPSDISFSISNLPSKPKRIQLIIENQDGISSTISLYFGGVSLENKELIAFLSFLTGTILIVTYIFLRKKKAFQRLKK